MTRCPLRLHEEVNPHTSVILRVALAMDGSSLEDSSSALANDFRLLIENSAPLVASAHSMCCGLLEMGQRRQAYRRVDLYLGQILLDFTTHLLGTEMALYYMV